MPVICDESQRARSDQEMGESVYDVINGHARQRGTLKGLAASPGSHVVLLSTGERPLVHALKYGGLKSRVVSLHGSPFGEVGPVARDLVDRLSDGLVANHGHIGPAFMEWVDRNLGEAEEWKRRWEDERAAYRSISGGNNVAGRMSDYVAALEVAAWLAGRAINLPWDGSAVVEDLWEAVLFGADDADVAKAAFEDAVDWCRSHEASFMGLAPIDARGEPIQPAGGWFGAWRSNGEWEWAVVPHRLTDFLREQGYDASVTATWLDRGWMVTRESRRSTMIVRHGDRVIRAYVLSRKAVEELSVADSAGNDDVT